MFTPSPYQEAIFDHVAHSEDDLLVKAVPGSGKTTTSIEACSRLSPLSDVLFLAFGKQIATELERKLPSNIEVSTSHSFGMSLIKRNTSKRAKVEPGKYRDYVFNNGRKLVNKKRVTSFYPLMRMIDIIRLSDTNIFSDDKESLRQLRLCSETYGVNGIKIFDTDLLQFIRAGIDWGIDWFQKTGEIDFCDMLYLPVELDFGTNSRFDYVFVDEVQDFSNLQIELMKKTVSDYGKFIMVGDPNQACFKFAGAGKASVATIQNTFEPDVLPLSICYRCPTSHIELANRIYPIIEPRDNAPKGTVESYTITQSQVLSLAEEEDLIICRRVSPLIGMCLDFIFEGIPAVVKGKGVKETLFRCFDEIEAQAGFRYSNVEKFLEDWYLNWAAIYSEQYENPKAAISDLDDRYEAIQACIQRFEYCQSFRDIKNVVNDIFKENDNAVQLSSIHSAKGLESNRVFLLEANNMPFQIPGATPDDMVQERNLHYIALTRSKDVLFLVEKDDDD